MESLYSVKLGKLIQEFNLEVLRGRGRVRGAAHPHGGREPSRTPAHRLFRLF